MAFKVRAVVVLASVAVCVGALVIWDHPWDQKVAVAVAVLGLTYVSFEANYALERIHRLEHRLGLGTIEDDAEWQKARPSLGYKD